MSVKLFTSKTAGILAPAGSQRNLREGLVWSALFLLLIGLVPAGATTLFPTNYTATPGDGIAQGGFFNYFDDTGRQLSDGHYGTNAWSANLGNGPAYQWVGWRGSDPTITFHFSGEVTINQVGIDFNRTESDMIFLPSTVSIDGTDFTVMPNAIPDATRGTLFFDGLWSGTSLTICLKDCSPAQWNFVDEFTFGSASVPEPSAFLLLAGGLVFLGRRWKRN